MKTKPGAIVAALSALAVLTLGACSDDEPTTAEPKGDSTSEATVDPSRVSPEDLPEVPEMRRSKGAVADASFGECTAAEGTQAVTGTITNPTSESKDYVVTVSWINDTYDVLARGVAAVDDLPAGGEREIEVSATVPAGAESCTFHVARGELK